MSDDARKDDDREADDPEKVDLQALSPEALEVAEDITEVDNSDLGLSPVVDDPGRVLYSEPGSTWWPILLGPVLIGAILTMEALGPGQVHWAVMAIFFVVITGPCYLFITAAREYASVELTEKTLRCGTRRINLADIETIYPQNNGADYKDWQKAPALGGLPAVPRGRKGIGLKTVNGKLSQAWARDVDRLRTELTQAHMAVQMGL
ncbi:DUF3093 domain-containing protein [Gordonia sp. (in: high G+C Gram-positive bacteria)]|uniref:DUF3093 domain-containing protein n=1 Tax=Gordonia sp. (in: high G+C Gram-positive bacteria) TaxID=84139 RepID=UPI0039E27677